MKPSRNPNFPITVQHDILDVPEEERAWYEGIYRVRLNYTIAIMFVPDFERGSGPWPPVAPGELPVDTPRMARIAMADAAHYVVTPDHTRANQTEVVTTAIDASAAYPEHTHTIVLFYVAPEAFAVYQRELDPLVGGIHSGTPVSELTDRAFVQLLRNRILVPDYLSQRELHLLGLASA